ncbi:deoxyribonuclease IV [Bacillus salitolerans]|uniref:Deoxyribonuclease IV n=1 Tax=Bacillus salitolerans TaxID=1437434 RepID=A0ABW4LPW3_9BACI
MYVGCHVSIRDGYLGAAKMAHSFGASAFQYFPKNPRSLSVKEFDQEDATACKQYCLEHNIQSVAHTPYSTSLTPTEQKKGATIQSLLNDLQIASSCGSIGVVVHFGSEIDPLNPLAGYQLMITILNEVLKEWDGDALLLIENLAGKPGTMGTTIEEHIQIRNLCDFPEKIGFCFDTCHAFASGLWNGENSGALVKSGKEQEYFNHLKVVHLNNSKYESSSGKDRHDNIVSGKIKVSQLNDLLHQDVFSKIPFVLETPDPPSGNHREEIETVRTLFNR